PTVKVTPRSAPPTGSAGPSVTCRDTDRFRSESQTDWAATRYRRPSTSRSKMHFVHVSHGSDSRPGRPRARRSAAVHEYPVCEGRARVESSNYVEDKGIEPLALGLQSRCSPAELIPRGDPGIAAGGGRQGVWSGAATPATR